MSPVMPGILGHFCVRSTPSIVGSTVKWQSQFSPRGLTPMRSRMERVQPLRLPLLKPAARPAPRLSLVSPFTLLPVSPEQPSC